MFLFVPKRQYFVLHFFAKVVMTNVSVSSKGLNIFHSQLTLVWELAVSFVTTVCGSYPPSLWREIFINTCSQKQMSLQIVRRFQTLKRLQMHLLLSITYQITLGDNSMTFFQKRVQILKDKFEVILNRSQYLSSL
jgi:hypothetical protein